MSVHLTEGRKITDVGQVPIKVDILKDCVTV